MNECRLLKKDKARRGERIAYYVKQLPGSSTKPEIFFLYLWIRSEDSVVRRLVLVT